MCVGVCVRRWSCAFPSHLCRNTSSHVHKSPPAAASRKCLPGNMKYLAPVCCILSLYCDAVVLFLLERRLIQLSALGDAFWINWLRLFSFRKVVFVHFWGWLQPEEPIRAAAKYEWTDQRTERLNWRVDRWIGGKDPRSKRQIPAVCQSTLKPATAETSFQLIWANNTIYSDGAKL